MDIRIIKSLAMLLNKNGMVFSRVFWVYLLFYNFIKLLEKILDKKQTKCRRIYTKNTL